MKRNARKLMALVMGLALLASMFAMAEDGMPEAIDLGGDIVIDAGTGTAGGNNDDTMDGEGELEIELDGEVEPADRLVPELDVGLDLDAALDLDAGASESVAGGEANGVGDEEAWVAWEPTDELPLKSGN